MTISLRFMLEKVELTNTTQDVKDQCYQQVLNARKLKPESIDYLGFNELHWAVICNQAGKVSYLVKEKLCDINVGTSMSHSKDFQIHNWNLTPIMIATQRCYHSIIGIFVREWSRSKNKKFCFPTFARSAFLIIVM